MSRPAAIIKPIEGTPDGVLANVFSNERHIDAPDIDLPETHLLNERLQMDALTLLGGVPDSSIPAAFLDPQYRGVLDKMKYGNEGKDRGKARVMLPQMTEADIAAIVNEIDRVLIPSGHLFIWMDKFHLCQGFGEWLDGTKLERVDLVVWCKEHYAMGYRTRRQSEYLVVLQKLPRRAKGVWTIHTIPDVWWEQIPRGEKTTHRKPVDLQGELIAAVTNASDIVLDPAAGSFSVMDAALRRGRNFLGADILG